MFSKRSACAGSHRSFLKFLLIVFILPLFLASCGGKGTSLIYRRDHQLISELQSKRIVMLGDFFHGSASSLHTVTGALNVWLDMITEGKRVPRHLTLVLESDSSTVQLLKNYASNGAGEQFLDHMLPYGTLENLEFYDALRTLSQRIDSLNQTLPVPDRIVFDIFGAEPRSLLSDRSYMRSSLAEGWKFFVQHRDSLVAYGIESYLSNNPLQKALVFYGNAHLINGYVTNGIHGELPGMPNLKGYYLVHYLKKFFGKRNVLSVNQEDLQPNQLKGTAFQPAAGRAFFAYSSQISARASFIKDYDAVIIRPEAIVPPHPLDLVFSRRVMKACILNLDTLQTYLPGYDAAYYSRQLQDALNIMTGQSFKTAKQWGDWFKSHKYNWLSRLNSKAFEDQIIADFYKQGNDYQKRMDIYYLCVPVLYARQPSKIDTATWRDSWNRILYNIECVNAIGIYRIGFPDEKREVHQWLVDHTGRDFRTADRYLKWWRHVEFDANY